MFNFHCILYEAKDDIAALYTAVDCKQEGTDRQSQTVDRLA
jgi:hypothetical protein